MAYFVPVVLEPSVEATWLKNTMERNCPCRALVGNCFLIHRLVYAGDTKLVSTRGTVRCGDNDNWEYPMCMFSTSDLHWWIVVDPG